MTKYWKFKIFRKIIQKMRWGYSPVVLVTGHPNAGKTMLGGLLAEAITWDLHRQPWNPKDYCFFDMNQLSYRLLNARKQAILIAEAGWDLSFDQWMSKCNRFFDKVVTTQRVMGNCYILNIPVAKDLARRQRRKVDFLFDVKRWGLAKVWEVKIKTREMAGNEFGGWYWGEISNYPLPKCYKLLKLLDEENKNRIRGELVTDFQEELKIEEIKKAKPKTKLRCGECGYEWIPRKKHPRRCPGCMRKLLFDDDQLSEKEVSGEDKND